MGLGLLPALGFLALACSGEPVSDEPPPVDPDEARRQAEALYTPEEPAPVGAGAGAVEAASGAQVDVDDASVQHAPVQVVLVWDGISALHQSFFADSEIVTGLSSDLAGEVRGPANVYVRYDSTKFTGSIRLQLRPDTLLRKPRREGDAILLQDIAPVTRALATYRTAVASRKDYRIESFAVGIESFRGPRACVFTVAGRPPPDGRLVSPCVQVNGKEHCGVPGTDGVRFAPDIADDVAACLDL